MSLNPISTLNPITEITASQDVLMILDKSTITTKQILISEFNAAVQSTSIPLSGTFLGSFFGDGTGITGIPGLGWDGQYLGNASITGSFTVSGSNSLVNFTNVGGGVSGSFSGSYSGSFSGNGGGLYNYTIESSSYILSTGVDGLYGMNSILSASHAVFSPSTLFTDTTFSASNAVSSSYAVSSSNSNESSYSLSSSTSAATSYALSSSSAVSSSYAQTASYYDGGTGGGSPFASTASYYATSDDLQVTGSWSVSGSLSTDTLEVLDGGGLGQTIINGQLHSQGGTQSNVRRFTMDGSATTNTTITETDNIVYIDITAARLNSSQHIVTLPSSLGRSITLLVKNPNHHELYLKVTSNGGVEGINNIPVPATGLRVDNYLSYLGEDPFPTFIKYDLLCTVSSLNVYYLMNINFNEIFSTNFLTPVPIG